MSGHRTEAEPSNSAESMANTMSVAPDHHGAGSPAEFPHALVTASPAYYDDKLFVAKRHEYRFAGIADRMKFAPFIGPQDRVLDFGCRGGYLLANFECGERLGIEPSSRFREECAEAGVPAVPTLGEVPDHWADVLISHHVLEHVPSPYETLMELRRKVRPGGTVVFVVPCESVKTAYDPGDPHNHLFTWSPLNLGNLFKAAGYRVLRAEACFHRWPPKGSLLQRRLGWKAFHALSWAYGRLFTRLSQTIVVATPAGGG